MLLRAHVWHSNFMQRHSAGIVGFRTAKCAVTNAAHKLRGASPMYYHAWAARRN